MATPKVKAQMAAASQSAHKRVPAHRPRVSSQVVSIASHPNHPAHKPVQAEDEKTEGINPAAPPSGQYMVAPSSSLR